jgi:hypothetical protein
VCVLKCWKIAATWRASCWRFVRGSSRLTAICRPSSAGFVPDGPAHAGPDGLEARAVDPRERAEVEHERRGPPAGALGPRRGSGPPVAEVAGRRVGVERAERAAALGVARAGRERGRVGVDAPELAASRGGGELAQRGGLHAGLLVAGRRVRPCRARSNAARPVAFIAAMRSVVVGRRSASRRAAGRSRGRRRWPATRGGTRSSRPSASAARSRRRGRRAP